MQESMCRLFTIDWFKPEIVTGQYNSRAGISNGEKSMLLFTHELIENVTECSSFSHGFPFST
jgi:hypothetical protein